MRSSPEISRLDSSRDHPRSPRPGQGTGRRSASSHRTRPRRWRSGHRPGPLVASHHLDRHRPLVRVHTDHDLPRCSAHDASSDARTVLGCRAGRATLLRPGHAGRCESDDPGACDRTSPGTVLRSMNTSSSRCADAVASAVRRCRGMTERTVQCLPSAMTRTPVTSTSRHPQMGTSRVVSCGRRRLPRRGAEGTAARRPGQRSSCRLA